eukprot:gene15378-18194_t
MAQGMEAGNGVGPTGHTFTNFENVEENFVDTENAGRPDRVLVHSDYLVEVNASVIGADECKLVLPTMAAAAAGAKGPATLYASDHRGVLVHYALDTRDSLTYEEKLVAIQAKLKPE